jgi:TetR/AcrR family transcriptional regulator
MKIANKKAGRRPASNQAIADTRDEHARNQILDCAITVFSQQGFGGASIRDIANAAGVNHSMIKYYFGGKEQLWRAAVKYLFQRQKDELAPKVQVSLNLGPVETMRTVIEELIRYNARHPEHARLVMQSSMTPGPHLDWILEHVKPLHHIYYGHNEIDGQDITTAVLHYLIYGACQAVFTLEYEAQGLFGIDVTTPEFIDRFIELATRFLLPAALQAIGAESEAPNMPQQRSASKAPRLKTKMTREGLELWIQIPGYSTK